MAVCNSADSCRRVVAARDTLTYLLRGCRRRGRMPGRRCQRKEDPLRAEGVVLGIPLSHLLGLTWAVACANDWRPGNRARGWGRIGGFAAPRLTTEPVLHASAFVDDFVAFHKKGRTLPFEEMRLYLQQSQRLQRPFAAL